MNHSKTTHTGLGLLARPDTSNQDEQSAAPRCSQDDARFLNCLISTLNRVLRGFYNFICASWLNVIFVLIPVGVLVNYYADSPLLSFICNVAAMLPSAHLLSIAVEDFSIHLDGLAGGVATVILRNTRTLIISLILLSSHQDRTLASLFYGILPANLLLGPGLQFIVGGVQWHVQDFTISPVQTMISCVFLGIFGLSMVTLGSFVRDIRLESQVVLLRGVSYISLACYIAYLLFRLITHFDLFLDSNLQRGLSRTDNEDNDRNKTYFPSAISASGGVILCTVMLAISTKLATDQIPQCVRLSHLSDFSIGFVILPIAVNNPFFLLGTRQTSVDVRLIIALDRTVQLVLLYIPIFWLLIWTFDEHVLFQVEAFATIALLLSAFVFGRVLSKGRAHWFTGLMMVVIYTAISIGAFLV